MLSFLLRFRTIRKFVARRSKLLNAPWDWQGNPPDKDAIGRLGEAMAELYLATRGCRILYKNFKAPEGGEVDITVRHGEVLAFVEVKTRTTEAFGRPALAVDLKKRRLISRGVRAWLGMLPQQDIGWRCDIVEVILTRKEKPLIRWIRSAFTVEMTKRDAAAVERKKA